MLKFFLYQTDFKKNWQIEILRLSTRISFCSIVTLNQPSNLQCFFLRTTGQQWLLLNLFEKLFYTSNIAYGTRKKWFERTLLSSLTTKKLPTFLEISFLFFVSFEIYCQLSLHCHENGRCRRCKMLLLLYINVSVKRNFWLK